MRVIRFGEEHTKTAESYFSLGLTQQILGDFSPAFQCHQRALEIRVQPFGEEHLDTAQSVFSLGETEHALGGFNSVPFI